MTVTANDAGDRGLSRLARLVLDDGRHWAQAATAWQWADARAVLDPPPDGPFLHWLGRPKGGSKSTDLAGVGIAWLLEQAPAMSDGYALAADLDQANRLLDKARGFVARDRGLGQLIEVQASRIVNRQNGARVHALAADVAGSEGLLTPFVVVDELPNWPETYGAKAMWTSVVSAVPKWPGMRLTVIGHAGAPEHWSHKVYERAAASDAWRLNDVPGPLEWVRPQDLDEQRALLTPSQYARRHENRWTSGEDKLTTRADVLACASLDGPQAYQSGHRYVISADLGVKRDRSCVIVAHSEELDPARSTPGPEADVAVAGGRFHMTPQEDAHRFLAPHEIDALRARQPRPAAPERAVRICVDRKLLWKPKLLEPVELADVEAQILEAWRLFHKPPVVLDPWQAIGMSQRLRAQGVEVEEFTFNQASVGRLASTLFGVLRDHRLAIDAEDEDLIDELSRVQLREKSPGVMRMDHLHGQHDDQAITLALAAQHLLATAPQQIAQQINVTDSRLKGRRAR